MTGGSCCITPREKKVPVLVKWPFKTSLGKQVMYKEWGTKIDSPRQLIVVCLDWKLGESSFCHAISWFSNRCCEFSSPRAGDIRIRSFRYNFIYLRHWFFWLPLSVTFPYVYNLMSNYDIVTGTKLSCLLSQTAVSFWHRNIISVIDISVCLMCFRSL